MSISLVSAGSAASSADSVTPSFGQSTTSGNLLLAWAWSNNSGSSYPISTPSGWTLAKSGGAGYNWAGLYYKANCGSGESAPAFSDSGYTLYAALSEWSGAATSSPLDQTGASVGNPVTAGGVNTAAGDLIVGLAVWNGSNADGLETDGIFLVFSDGVHEQSNTVQTNELGTSEPYYTFDYGVENIALGSNANVGNASSSEYEGYPTELIASFKAA